LSRRVLLRAAEAATVAVVALVLPLLVQTTRAYVACAVPCLIAGAGLGYLDARSRRK
jgi:hypothetical protein